MEVSQLLKVYRKKAAIVKTKLINKSTLYAELPWKDIETYDVKAVGIRRVVYITPGNRKVAKAGRHRLIVIPKESGIREGEYVLIYREGDKIIVEA